MRHHAPVFFSVASIALVSALTVSAAPTSTAFLRDELDATTAAGVSASVGSLSAAVEAALLATAGLTLQSASATAQFMETAKGLGVTCDRRLDQCLLEIAGLCTVDQAVYGHVDDGTLTLRVAVVRAAAVRSVSLKLDPRPDVLGVSIREAVLELVAPTTAAALVVDAPAGSLVSLDGLERSVAPMAVPLTGISPGHHFIDVRFPDGSTSTKAVVLTAGERTRVILMPRPLGADVMVWTGWGTLAAAGAAFGVATFSAGAYMYSRAVLEHFSTHYAVEAIIDYNDGDARRDAIAAQDHLTDLPTYGYPLFVTAAVAAAVGGGLLYAGYGWSERFDPPTEATAR